MSGTFVAQYRGSCGADCGHPIEPGQDARYFGQVVVHNVCPKPVDPLAVATSVCPRCYMERAASGACGCD